MKSLLLILCIVFVCTSITYAQRYWIATTAGNWNNTSNWSASSGGGGGASVPGSGDQVIFNGIGGRNGNCAIDVAVTVAGVTLNGYTGTLDLGGFDLNTTGPNVLTSGVITNSGAVASLLINTAQGTTFNGTAVGVPVSGTTGDLLFSGSVFSGAVNLTKTSGTNNNGAGGNTFNGTLALTNNGNAELNLAVTNPDTYNAAVTLNNNGASRMQVAVNSTGNVFTAGLTINNSGTSAGVSSFICRNASSGVTINGNLVLNNNSPVNSGIIVAQDGAVTINGNVSVTNASGLGVYFGGDNTNRTGTVTLANGFSVSSPAGTFTTGSLYLMRFTQNGGTTQTLNNLSGTASLVVGPSSQFTAIVNFAAPQIFLNGATYSSAATFEKTGATDSYSTGGNTFNGVTTITNTGSGAFVLGNNNADTFNGVTTFNNNGSHHIHIAQNHGGQTTTFASAVTMNSNKPSGSDQFSYAMCEGTNTNVSFAAALTINCAGSTRSDHRFGQGTGSTAVYGGTTTFNVTNSNPSTTLFIGTNGVSTFNGNIVVVNNGGANGLFFNYGGGSSSTLAASRTISIGGGGFNGGFLSLPRFTQTGATAQTLTTFSGTAAIILGPSSSFDGALNLKSPQVYLNGTTFGGAATIEKNGAGDNTGAGSNVFNNSATITNSSSGYLRTQQGNTFNGATQFINTGSNDMLFELNSGSNYNGNLTLTNTGTSSIRMTWQGTTQFNGNIVVNCTGGNGIYFGENTGTGTLAATKTITTGGSGFSTGLLSLRNFTQTGATAQTLNTFSGTAALFLGPFSSFDGAMSVKAPQIYLQGATYNGAAMIEKSGAGDNNGTGNNTFNSSATIVSSGSGYLRTNGGNIFNGTTQITNAATNDLLLELNIGSTYGGDVTFTNTGTSYIRVAFQGTTQFNGNITVNSTAGIGIYFSESTGTSTLADTKTISIGGSGFSVGNLSLRNFTQVGSAAQTLNTFSGTCLLYLGPSSSFSGAVNFRAPQIYLQGATYNGTTVIEKNGAGDNTGTGGNTFNGNLTLINNSTGNFRTQQGNIFSGTTQITNNGSNDILLELSSGSTYNGDVTFTNTGTSSIRVGYQGSNFFNGNIIVNCTSGNGINFCESTGVATLAATKTITIGASGFSTGYLILRDFTQVGATPQTLDAFSGTALLQSGPGSSFDGNVSFKAPQILMHGAVYNGTANIEKTGATDNASNGGNTFSGVTTITNSGSGLIYMGNGTADTFNGVTTFNNTGSYRVSIAHNHNGQTTTFGSDVTLNSNKSSGTDTWSFFMGENTNTNIAFNGNLTINCAGSLESDHRFLNGAGSTATFGGTVTVNLTNTQASTIITMGTNGTSTYNGNIVVTNPAGVSGIAFNAGATASSTLAAGRTITIGAGGFTGGTLNLPRFTQTGSTPQTLTAFSGTARLIVGPSSAFAGSVNFVAPQVYLNGCVYGGTANIEKTGAGDNYGTGANVFNGTTTLTTSGSGYFLTGGTNADAFNGVTTFNNNGSYRLYFAFNHPGQTTTFATDVFINSNRTGSPSDQWSYLIAEANGTSAISFGGNVTINCAGAVRSDIRFLNGMGTALTYTGTVTINVSNTEPNTAITMGGNGTSTYNGNIVVTNTGGATGIYFNNYGPTATSTLATGRTISIGPAGFNGGTLSLIRFTQLGATAQTLTAFSGTARLIVGPTAAFDGNVDFRAPQVYLNGCVYSGTANIEKNGATDNYGAGGNVFNGATTLTAATASSGFFLTGGTNADTFNGVTTFNNNGSNRLYFAYNHPGQTTTFATDVVINANKSGGVDPYSYMIQEATSTTGLTFGGNVTVNCLGTLRSDIRFLQGIGTTTTYTGVVAINVSNTNSNTTITMGGNGTSTYNGDIVVTSTGGANGIFFNAGSTGTSTMVAGRTITIGAGGFNAGSLSLIRFTQLGTTPQSLTTFSGTASLVLGPSSAFGGNVNFKAPQIYLNGTVYSGTATIEKSAASDNAGTGGNIFNGVTTISNSGTGYLMTGNVSADAFNAATTFNSTGAYRIYFAHNHTGQTTTFASDVTLNSNKTSGADQYSFLVCEGNNSNISVTGIFTINCAGTIRSENRILNGISTGTFGGTTNINVTNSNANTAVTWGVNGSTTFNGNVVVTNSGGSGGIQFNTGSSATATLAAARTITIGAGGFSTGILNLPRFTQVGPTAQALNTFSGTANLTIGPSSAFGGDVNFKAPQIYLNGAVYSGAVYAEKTGAANNDHTGGNTFGGATTIVNSSAARMRLAGTNADTYNGSAAFVKSGAGALEPAYNLTNTFAGDLSTNTNAVVIFGVGTGVVEFTGSALQTVSKTASTSSPTFQRVRFNKTASTNSITFNTDVTIGTAGTFTTGIAVASGANFLNFANGATATGMTDASYVDGPVRKTGTNAFTFPVGAGNFYRAIGISAPTTASDHFTAQYFKSGQTFGGRSTWPSAFWTVSGCEYWILNRTNGTSNVNVTLSWNTAACSGVYVTNPANLRVTRWSGTAWINHGNGGTTGTTGNGTLVSSGTVNSFSPFTLASITSDNPLPVVVEKFWAENTQAAVTLKWNTASELNSDFFTLQRSSNGFDFETINTVKGAGTSSEQHHYNHTDDGPLQGLSYYRLLQTDYDGSISSWILAVKRDGEDPSFSVSPNPAGDEVITFSQKVSIVITNSLGQEIGEYDEVVSIDVSNLAPGIYVIRNQKGQVTRLIKD